jgi:hypothetical protein
MVRKQRAEVGSRHHRDRLDDLIEQHLSDLEKPETKKEVAEIEEWIRRRGESDADVLLRYYMRKGRAAAQTPK